MYTSVDAINAAMSSTRLKTFLPPADDPDTEDLIEAKIAASSAEMDACFTRIYTLPLGISDLTVDQQSNINELLSSWCIAITVYMLVAQSASDVPKAVQIAYDRAMSRLREIREGKYKLPYLPVAFTPVIGVAGDRENVLTPSMFNLSRIV